MTTLREAAEKALEALDAGIKISPESNLHDRFRAALAVQPQAEREGPSIEDLTAGLQFYAKRFHFDMSDDSAWDTVSGEPQNFWCDEAGTATVEDGSVARAVLAGGLTAAQLSSDDEDSVEWQESAAPAPAHEADAGEARDAARYRYLRGGKARTGGSPRAGRIEVFRWDDRMEGTQLKGEALDAAIDAALSQPAPKEPQ
jgi:hypothetical protein